MLYDNYLDYLNSVAEQVDSPEELINFLVNQAYKQNNLLHLIIDKVEDKFDIEIGELITMKEAQKIMSQELKVAIASKCEIDDCDDEELEDEEPCSKCLHCEHYDYCDAPEKEVPHDTDDDECEEEIDEEILEALDELAGILSTLN